VNSPPIELPLVLEQTARWYFIMGSVAAVIWFVLGRTLLEMRRRQWQDTTPTGIAVVAGLLLFSLVVALVPLGFRLQLDRAGVSLRAPVEFWEQHGTIAWKELSEVRFGSTMATRSGSFPTLEFVGHNGKVLELKALNAVPASWWPALAAAIENNAPQVDLRPDRDGWAKRALRIAGPGDSDRALVGYAAHDGAGHELK
jgi:hypothetical protein